MPNFLMVDVDLLRPNPWNSNLVAPENEAKLVESVRRLGIFKPVITRGLEDGSGFEILGGEHRWQAAKLLKHKKIAVFDHGVIDDETAKKIALADNARYGADDTIKLAELLEGMEDGASIHEILPFTEADVSAIFSSVTIALDELELDSGFEEKAAAEMAEPQPEKAPKTHVIMRFKVTLADGEKVTELISKTKKKQGFTGADDLTNAGDALVHTLFGASG